LKKDTKFELRNVDDLIPYARNARTHSPEQVQKLAGSIKEFGFLNPVVISEDGGILAGHGRVMAAQKLGIKQVPCVVESHLTEAQRKAYILADNRLALDAGWDEEMLAVELKELKGEYDFDMELLGFSDEELKQFGVDEPIDEDFEPTKEPDDEVEFDESIEPVTELCDVWILGDHRLICGDSRDADVVEKVIAGNKPNLMVTDPPYGVKYDPTSRVKPDEDGGVKKSFSKGAKGSVMNDDETHWKESYSLFGGNVAYIWCSATHIDDFMGDLKECGFEISSMIIWNKSQLCFGRADYHWKHEPCLYATKGEHNWKGGRKQTTVWDIQTIEWAGREEGKWGHGTQKPIECMKRPIENNSDPGDWVYDPFCGSGTTIIAAEQTGRKCIGIELSPIYCDAICRRFENVTGKKAIRESDGAEFSELIAARDKSKA
jgi:DNA modification methylase